MRNHSRSFNGSLLHGISARALLRHSSARIGAAVPRSRWLEAWRYAKLGCWLAARVFLRHMIAENKSTTHRTHRLHPHGTGLQVIGWPALGDRRHRVAPQPCCVTLTSLYVLQVHFYSSVTGSLSKNLNLNLIHVAKRIISVCFGLSNRMVDGLGNEAVTVTAGCEGSRQCVCTTVIHKPTESQN